ncbi:MAG: ATP-binding protein [Paludibacteraceae bacterium]|nr:ATP-binding protein [Paludibacteraceae bacterium]
MKYELKIKNKVDELSKLPPFVNKVCGDMKLGDEMTMNLNLVLEEAVSNVVLYAYPKGSEDDDIDISATTSDKSIVFVITDRGVAFDPLQVGQVDTTLPADDRQIGGLGIFIIKNIMNELEYQRVEGKNVFILKKVIQSEKN